MPRVAAAPGHTRHPTAELLRAEAGQAPGCLSVAHVNAESLFGHFDEFHDIFISSNFHIICVSESWLSSRVASTSVHLPGYTLFRTDRVGLTRGGVAVYVQSHLQTTVLSSSGQHGRPEYMFLKVKLFTESILIGVCYRPPKVGFLCDFETALVDLLVDYKHVLILGDFNADLLSTRPASDVTIMRNIIESCNLTLLQSGATHHTGNTHTLLDLVLTADPARVQTHGKTSVPGLSKHDLVYVVYKVRTPRLSHRNVTYRDLNNLDFQALIDDAKIMPWSDVDNFSNVDDMVSHFNNMILTLFDKHAPLRTVRVKRPPAPWITPEIRSLMKERDAAWRRYKRTGDVLCKQTFRSLRNRVKQSIRNSKLRYAHSIFSGENNSKSMWKNVKRFGIAARNNQDNCPKIPINELNGHFVNSGAPTSQDAVKRHLSHLESQEPPGPHVFQLRSVTLTEVKKAVARINTKAIGADGISIKFIKPILDIIIKPICSIFNRSINTSTFPSEWKLSHVLPLPKKSNPVSASDYRPISILPVLSKALERLVHQQVCSYMITNKLFDPFQSGFRAGHSTTTALLKVTDDIRLAMDKRLVTILLLFDFSKAFDSVNHKILLQKLRLLGFSPTALAWISSYLSGRLQKTLCSGIFSDPVAVTCGVPQGSVLGPLLFSIFVHDISKTLNFSKYHIYADDLQIYFHSSLSDLFTSIGLVNSDVCSLVSWVNEHGLLLNAKKTQPIIIGSSRIMSKIVFEDVPNIVIGDVAVPYCRTVTDLGLVLNTTLSWTEQVTKTCNKVFAAMHTLKSSGWMLPFKMKELLVKSLVLPIFDYGSSVYCDVSVELASRLQRAQNYCVRYLFNLRRDDRVSAAYEQLGWLRLNETRKLHNLNLTFKIIRSGIPEYLSQSFVFLSQISGRTSRINASTLAIPRHSTVMYNRSFCVSSCRLWNALPEQLRTSVKFEVFKKGLRRWLVDSTAD